MVLSSFSLHQRFWQKNVLWNCSECRCVLRLMVSIGIFRLIISNQTLSAGCWASCWSGGAENYVQHHQAALEWSHLSSCVRCPFIFTVLDCDLVCSIFLFFISEKRYVKFILLINIVSFEWSDPWSSRIPPMVKMFWLRNTRSCMMIWRPGSGISRTNIANLRDYISFSFRHC